MVGELAVGVGGGVLREATGGEPWRGEPFGDPGLGDRWRCTRGERARELGSGIGIITLRLRSKTKSSGMSD